MLQTIKMMMALLIVGFTLTACGPGGNGGTGGDAATEQPADDS